MKIVAVAALATTMILSAVAVTAAPNLYGTGGLIEIPDDSIYAVGEWTPAYHGVYDVSDSGQSLNTYTVGTGIIPNLSASAGVVDFGDTNLLLNAKYRILSETSTRPSVTVGVIDLTSEIGQDPSIYIVVGRNLTAAAEEVAGGESKPLRGYIGFGTDILDGVFLGLDWTLSPKFSAMLEFVGSDEGIVDGSHFNGGIRYALTNELRLDAGLVDFSDFTAGISYNALKF